MAIYSIGDPVYRVDSGSHAATVSALDLSSDEALYRLSYEEGGEGWWPESALYATIAERDAAIGS